MDSSEDKHVHSQPNAAIDSVSKETRQEVRRSYMIAIKHEVKQIGDRLAAIEKRLDALEKKN
jgi:ubiquinone biosynthesis protein UbiJ